MDHYDPDQLLIDDEEVMPSPTQGRRLPAGDSSLENSWDRTRIIGRTGAAYDMSSISSSDSEEDSIDALTAKALSREVSEMKERDQRRAEEDEMSTTEEEEEEEENADTVKVTPAANGFPRQEKKSPPPPETPRPPPPSKAVQADRFTEGYLVWARVKGYSFWPAIVTVDPVECVTVKHSEPNLLSSKSVVTSRTHIHFLGYANQRAWVPESGIIEYKGTKQYEEMRDRSGWGKFKKTDFIPAKRYTEKFDKAVKEAEEVYNLPYRRRLEKLNLVYVLVDTAKDEQMEEVTEEKKMRRASSPETKTLSGKKRKKSVSGDDSETNNGTKSKFSPPAKKRRKSNNSIRQQENVASSNALMKEPDPKRDESPGVKAEAKLEGKSSDEGFVETAPMISASNPSLLASPRPSTSTGSSISSPTVKKKGSIPAYRKPGKKSYPSSPPAETHQRLPQRTPSPIRPRPLPLPTVHVQSPAHVDEIRDINVRREPDDLDTSDDDDDDSSGPVQPELPKLGSLIWGRLPGFPYWPCFVTRSPENEYKRDFGKRSEYHVQFFNWNDESGWVTKTLPWCSLEEYKILAAKIPKSRTSEHKAWNPPGKQMLQKWNEAYLIAHSTIRMTRRQRHDKHVVFYRKGKEPHASWLLNNLKPHHAGIKVFRREVADLASSAVPSFTADTSTSDAAHIKSSASSSPSSHKKKRKAVGAQKRTVKRCGRCSACKREDCRKCAPCKNMLKHGGTGSMKNMCCLKRRCTTKGYTKSWTTDQDFVEVSSSGKKKKAAIPELPVNAASNQPTFGANSISGVEKKNKSPVLDQSSISGESNSSPLRKLENKSRTSSVRKGKSTKAREREKFEKTPKGAHERFLAQISSLDLPPGWVIDANREFQSPEGLTFGCFEDAVKHLFQQNVVGTAVRKRSLSFSGERKRDQTPAISQSPPTSGQQLDQGWLIHRSDKIRYNEEEQTTDVAGQLESRITYFRDHSLARGWTVKKISAKKIWMGQNALNDRDKYLYIAPENPCFDSKVEVANYIEPKGHPALELEQLMSMSVLREKSPFLILAREKRAQSMLTIKLKDCVEDYANHPILGKAVIPCYVDMVKLPDIFLEHPNVYVRENANEMVITDVNTEEFIAKKIMYE